MLGRHAVERDEHERRARQVGEQPAGDRRGGEREAEIAWIRQQQPVAADHAERRSAQSALDRQGLADHEHDREQAHGTERRQRQEDRAPAREQQELAAEQRREQRRRAHDQHHGREHARRAVAAVEIAHRRARQHRPGAAAERFEEAQHDQGREIVRQRAAEARRGEQRQADEQRRATAEAIGDRAVDQLTAAEAEEERAQGQLRAGRRDAEIVGERRQAGQVHVGRHRRDRGQRAEREDQKRL